MRRNPKTATCFLQMEQQKLPRRERIKTGSAIALGAGLAACGAGNAQPAAQPAFVPVHGAWHNASTWTQVIPYLAQLGHAALAIDLPGHGLHARFPASWRRPQGDARFADEPSPLASVTLDDYVARILDAVEKARGLGNGQVIVVGHSLAGTRSHSPTNVLQAVSPSWSIWPRSSRSMASRSSRLRPRLSEPEIRCSGSCWAMPRRSVPSASTSRPRSACG